MIVNYVKKNIFKKLFLNGTFCIQMKKIILNDFGLYKNNEYLRLIYLE